MSKKKPDEAQQIDLFPVVPEIRGLSLSKFELKEGDITGILHGVTLTRDLAELTDECWRKAVAEWLVMLCRNDAEQINGYIDEQRALLHQREEERRLTQEAMAKIQAFPGQAIGALA